MGLAGFEPATSQSEAGHPIQARLQALVLVSYTLKILDFKKMFAIRHIEIKLFYNYKKKAIFKMRIFLYLYPIIDKFKKQPK